MRVNIQKKLKYLIWLSVVPGYDLVVHHIKLQLFSVYTLMMFFTFRQLLPNTPQGFKSYIVKTMDKRKKKSRTLNFEIGMSYYSDMLLCINVSHGRYFKLLKIPENYLSRDLKKLIKTPIK